MLICDRAQLSFVQIPKNGTKSVKAALEARFGLDFSPIAEDLGITAREFVDAYERGGVKFQPDIGTGNIDHLTLHYWHERFPRTWQRVTAGPSFALIRQPRDRFFSAMMQKLGNYGSGDAVRTDDPKVRDEAKRVCEWLSGRRYFTEHQYIHFTRQVDYVDLDGERIISAVFPIERTDIASAWVEKQTGSPLDVAHEHARREPKKWARAIQPCARFVGQHVIPKSVKQAIYPLWRNSGLFDDAAKQYARIELGEEVERFVEDYYAADFRLYDEAVAAIPAAARASAG